MAITPLPTPPSTNDPANFATKADALLAALPEFVTETNATAAAMNLNSTTDTSASSVAIGTGAKSFTVSTGKSFQPGMYLVIADTAAPSTNSMHGQITSYDVDTGALVMSISTIKGSGTKTAWTITQSSPGTAIAGPLAASGITGAAESGANTDITSLSGVTSINGVAVNGEVIHVRDQKAAGVDGGASGAGSQVRTLNTVVLNTIAGASLNLTTSEVTLPAGTYRVFARAPAYASNEHRVRLVNVTDVVNAVLGSPGYNNTAGAAQTNSVINAATLTIAATKVFNLTHFTAAAKAGNGLGVSPGDGLAAVYAELVFLKVA